MQKSSKLSLAWLLCCGFPLLMGARGCGEDIPIGQQYVDGSQDGGVDSSVAHDGAVDSQLPQDCTQAGCDDGDGTTYDYCVGETQCAHSKFCNGLQGLPCATGEYCDYRLFNPSEARFCGGGDTSGVCLPIQAGACPADAPGACGCDGRTYSNACVAGRSGISVAYNGPCVAAQ